MQESNGLVKLQELVENMQLIDSFFIMTPEDFFEKKEATDIMVRCFVFVNVPRVQRSNRGL